MAEICTFPPVFFACILKCRQGRCQKQHFCAYQQPVKTLYILLLCRQLGEDKITRDARHETQQP
jgi:hypothetical protein